MTLESFERAAGFLSRERIALRSFILLGPPFMPAEDIEPWACRSLTFAADCGACVSTVIPTRGGNGALEALEPAHVPPTLDALERVIEFGLRQQRGRTFADVWDIQRWFTCECSPRRAARLQVMNTLQIVPPRIDCRCDAVV